jgi:hypothetical protein
MSIGRFLRRLFGFENEAETAARRRHPHEEGHESRVGYLGKRGQAREADPAHKHHEHESGKS